MNVAIDPPGPDERTSLVWAVAFFITAVPAIASAGISAIDSVDPFIGVDRTAVTDDGATFPGATLPFGMLKAGPDMVGDNGAAGWKTGYAINGFSQTHVSGTGGGAEYSTADSKSGRD